GMPINVLDNEQRSPLWIAAENRNTQAIELLLNAGADPSIILVMELPISSFVRDIYHQITQRTATHIQKWWRNRRVDSEFKQFAQKVGFNPQEEAKQNRLRLYKHLPQTKESLHKFIANVEARKHQATDEELKQFYTRILEFCTI